MDEIRVNDVIFHNTPILDSILKILYSIQALGGKKNNREVVRQAVFPLVFYQIGHINIGRNKIMR